MSEPVPLEIVAVPANAQGKFSDTLDIDVAGRRLYMGDNWTGGLDVFDLTPATPEFVTTIKLRGRIYGVVAAPELGKVFAGMSGSSLAAVTLGAGKPTIELIHTGGSGHVDLIDYDPGRRRVFAANRLDGILTVIDAVNNRILGAVQNLGHGLEQPRLNPNDGLVYVTDNVENALYQVDPESGTLVAKFALEVPCYPNGMAINPHTNRAVLACSKSEPACTLVWDFETRRIAATIADCGGADGAVYDATADRFMVAASEAAGGPVIGVFAGGGSKLLATIPSVKGASWVGFDPTVGLVYTPGVADSRPALVRFPLPDWA